MSGYSEGSGDYVQWSIKGCGSTYRVPTSVLLRSTAYDSGSENARYLALGEEGSPVSEDVHEREMKDSESRLDQVSWIREVVDLQSGVLSMLFMSDILDVVDCSDPEALFVMFSHAVKESVMASLSVLHDVSLIDAGPRHG